MTSTALRIALAVAVAVAALAPATAGAQAVGPGSSGGGSGGRPCETSPGTTVEDGYVSTWKTKYMRGSVTCTDGTLCTSTGTLQGDNKTMVWHYECTDANGQTFRTVKRCTTRRRVTRCRVISRIQSVVSPAGTAPVTAAPAAAGAGPSPAGATEAGGAAPRAIGTLGVRVVAAG